MTKHFHLCLSVRGVLSQPREVAAWAKTAKNEGKPVSTEEFREWLFDQLKLGREVVPLAACDNFDYSTGCCGHEDQEEATS